MDEFRPVLWGKLRSTKGAVEFHPLGDHCADVAAAFRRILDTPRIRAALQSTTCSPLDALTLDRLAAIAYLHDIGKCNRGFQAKCDPRATATAGHVLEGAALLCDGQVAARWPDEFRSVLESASRWFEGGEADLLALLMAAISHHGRPVSFDDWQAAPGMARWWEPQGSVDPMAGVADFASNLRAAFPRAFCDGGPALQVSPAFQHRFAGLVMLADWIGSDTQFFPFRAHACEDRVALATAAAARALAQVGLSQGVRRDAVDFEQVFRFQLNPVQRFMATELPDDAAARLAILESETGSGKTEAALAWFFRLFAAGQVDGLYFALPTRVAARELYDRVLRAVEHAFPDPDSRPGPVLLAVPGYAKVDGNVAVLPDPDALLWEDQAQARWRERTWAAERPKRFLAAPVGVGTIDQALLSALCVKHSLLRSVCLDRHLLVVDEVHASDTYMREVLNVLLRGHVARGGHALLLSATLGESAAYQFLRRPLQTLAAASEQAYPRVSTVKQAWSLPGNGRDKHVTCELIDDLSDGALIPRLHHALGQGARVLVVCNTVARANALLRAMEAAGLAPAVVFGVRGIHCPHHGRFARSDRELMDAAVTAAFGRVAAAGPLLLVGTQTLEQSLDIDADWLVTDLCPMDVLLQRIGRLHRHGRGDRPADYSQPRVLVRTPPQLDLERYIGRHGELHGPAGIGRVYADGRILQRTADILNRTPSFSIPADNRRLVEGATHPEALATLESPRWKQHAGHLDGVELAAFQAATAASIEQKPFGELHWPAPDQAVLTRLGAGACQVRLAHPMSLFPGSMVDEVGIPAHMLPNENDWPEVVKPSPRPDGGFGFALGAKRYKYTRFGLEMDDA